MAQVSIGAQMLDPRLPGGVYVAGVTGRRYQVEAVYRGAEAAQLLGRDAGWAMAVIDLDDDELDGRVRIEQTPWDSDRDYVLADPGR